MQVKTVTSETSHYTIMMHSIGTEIVRRRFMIYQHPMILYFFVNLAVHRWSLPPFSLMFLACKISLTKLHFVNLFVSTMFILFYFLFFLSVQ
jgi:hypothetical protein